MEPLAGSHAQAHDFSQSNLGWEPEPRAGQTPQETQETANSRGVQGSLSLGTLWSACLAALGATAEPCPQLSKLQGLSRAVPPVPPPLLGPGPGEQDSLIRSPFLPSWCRLCLASAPTLSPFLCSGAPSPPPASSTEQRPEVGFCCFKKVSIWCEGVRGCLPGLQSPTVGCSRGERWQ